MYIGTSNDPRIKNNNSPFQSKFLTIFITFMRFLVSNKYMATQLILFGAIAVDALLEMKYNRGSGCYNIEHWL